MNEDKSARYHRLKRRTAAGALAWSALFLVALIGSGASIALRDLLAQVTGSDALLVCLYVGALACLHEIGSLPLAFYSGYSLEHRYGLSRQNRRQWFADHVKGTALGLGIGLVLASIVYGIMSRWPEWWWPCSS